MKKLLGCLVVALLGFTSVAFSSPFLISDPQCKLENDNGCAAGFELSLDDGATWGVMGSQDVGADKVMIHHDLGGFPEGMNNIQVRAVNLWGESATIPFSFTKSVPSAPTNMAVSPE